MGSSSSFLSLSSGRPAELGLATGFVVGGWVISLFTMTGLDDHTGLAAGSSFQWLVLLKVINTVEYLREKLAPLWDGRRRTCSSFCRYSRWSSSSTTVSASVVSRRVRSFESWVFRNTEFSARLVSAVGAMRISSGTRP